MESKLPYEKIGERKVLVKKESLTDPNQGCNPNERTVKDLINLGVINLNKPQGPTSHLTSDYLKKILNLSKAGHSGTLDPNVSGVLPIALERATRIVQTLLPLGKEYVAYMYLHKDHTEEEIRKTRDKFLGDIRQLPPVKSAVKREERTRTIHYFDILEIDGRNVLFKVGCQAGTYVRKLIYDFGLKIGSGAHMAQLVRTKVGPFLLENSVSLQDVTDAFAYYNEKKDEKELRKVIQPFEFAIQNMKKVWVVDNAVDNICHGAEVYVAGVSKLHEDIHVKDAVAIMTLKDEFIGLGMARMESEEMMKLNIGVAVKTHKVFMERGTYKKNEKLQYN